MFIRLITGKLYYTEYIKITSDGYISFIESETREIFNIPLENVLDINKNNPEA